MTRYLGRGVVVDTKSELHDGREPARMGPFLRPITFWRTAAKANVGLSGLWCGRWDTRNGTDRFLYGLNRLPRGAVVAGVAFWNVESLMSLIGGE